ncbi:MAG: hypothetical protein M3Y55_04685 [Pseudomonadota bacterium]|nr:hypothetical protein [Pseudomonadota bacterium]
MDGKKSSKARRVWRFTADAPLGEFVEIDPALPQPTASRSEIPLTLLDPAEAADWRSSSYDLLNGVEIRDHSDSLPGELFDKLFKRSGR